MNLPRRRRSRPKGRARLALAGDFPDTGESVTEILDRVRPADYDGSTVIFGGASDAGLPGGAYPQPAPVPATRQMSGKGWHMTVRTDGPGGTWNPRIRAAHTFLKLKWAYLEQRGMGYRIDEAEQVLERGEDLPAGSVIAETHREAVTHLVGDHGEWTPAGGWNHGWADSLPWYRPDDGDLGLPLGPRPDGAR
jgi:hypothetical protein